jgi:hypothetical protein
VEVVALPSTVTCHVIKLLKEIINRHGVPSRTISDPGWHSLAVS